MDDLFAVKEKAQQDVYTVSRLNFEVASLLTGTFPAFWITGEISNLASPPSGHIYFTLKDPKSQVRCAMFKGKNRSLGFRPQNGQQVLLQANVGLYEVRGDYQLNVLKMSEAGEGALRQKFDALKNDLQAKGWFDEAHKKPLPKMPQVVGLITSKDGAAIHDMVSTFKRRFPSLRVIVYPTLVQGKEATQKIVDAITIANQRQECDALIVGRGGGSLEDLWAFNELAVVTAIYESNLPIVSAVGHESDVTIADFVADFRAATPTAAAEALSPEANAVQLRLDTLAQQLHQLTLRNLRDKQQQLQTLTHGLPNMQLRYNQLNMRVDELEFRFQAKMKNSLQQSQLQVNTLLKRLDVQHPMSLLGDTKIRVAALQQRLQNRKPNVQQLLSEVEVLESRLQRAWQSRFSENQQYLGALVSRMDMASPLKTLARGYAIASDEAGNVLTDASAVKQGDTVLVRLNKGKLKTTVK